MSILDELAQSGVTAEDLEKAASVRLFEKAAAEENIDLGAMSDEDKNALYNHFVENVLPQLMGGGETSQQETAQEPKQASAPEQEVDLEKVASLLLFEKLAEEEEIDLSSLSEEDLTGLYSHFLENVLPEMVQEHTESAEKKAETEEAQAKLAEMEILGRHMARSFLDEVNKEAASPTIVPASGLTGKQKALLGGGAALGTAALGAGAYGAKKMYDKKKGSKEASALFDKLATDKAREILEANGINPDTGEKTEQAAEEPNFDELVEARAIEMLQAHGYTFEE